MTVQELKQTIVKKSKLGLYIFSGEETVIRDEYVKQIALMYGSVNYVTCDSLKEVIPRLSTKAMFDDNCVYVVKNDLDLLKNDGVWNNIISLIGDNCVIIIYSTMDKRTSFYKRFTNEIVMFDKLTTSALKKQVGKIIELDDEKMEHLISICNNDYGKILLEIDKLITYSKVKNLPPNFLYNQFLSVGGINIPNEDVGFNLVEKLMYGETKDFIQLISTISYTETIGILSLLYVGIKNTLLVKGCKSKNISGETGLSYFIVKNIINYPNIYTQTELQSMMLTIIKVINGIKNGSIDNKIALQYCALQLI